MSNENQAPNGAHNNESQSPVFAIQRIYIKDVSFEAPNLPEIYAAEYKPDVNMEMNSKSRSVGEDLYETVLTITLSAKLGEKTAFLVEVHQAGVFVLKNMTEEQVEQTLAVAAPDALYPYARETIASLISRAAFPPIHLTPVNFLALYMQRKQQEAAQAAGQQGDNGEVTVQ
jgi:preprotein translocase subunit SecB